MRRRLIPLLLAVLAAVALGACANKQERTLFGETEGAYLEVGDLKYQVQISRLLNPFDREDRAYFVDLPPGDRLGPDDEWFGVFLRVQNETGKSQPVAEDYAIKDTQGNVFRPIEPGPKNVFAFRRGEVPPREVVPLPDTAAAQGTIQGALLLFKIPNRNLENRPLELEISTPRAPGQVGRVDLDV